MRGRKPRDPGLPPRPYVSDAERGFKAIAARLFLNEYAVFLKLLHDDELNVQQFIVAMVTAYNRGDTNSMKIVADYKRLRSTDEGRRRDYVLDNRERNELYAEIERLEGLSGEDGT